VDNVLYDERKRKKRTPEEMLIDTHSGPHVGEFLINVVRKISDFHEQKMEEKK